MSILTVYRNYAITLKMLPKVEVKTLAGKMENAPVPVNGRIEKNFLRIN